MPPHHSQHFVRWRPTARLTHSTFSSTQPTGQFGRAIGDSTQYGTPFTVSTSGRLTTWNLVSSFKGDFILQDGDTITARGSNAAAFKALNNVVIGNNVQINASASGSIAGAAGGRGGGAGAGGSGGAGGAGGIGGAGVAGGSGGTVSVISLLALFSEGSPVAAVPWGPTVGVGRWEGRALLVARRWQRCQWRRGWLQWRRRYRWNWLTRIGTRRVRRLGRCSGTHKPTQWIEW